LDLSGFAKYEVSGPDSEQFLNRICANRMPAKDGGIVLAHVLSESGRIRAEMTITRLSESRFFVLSAAAAELRDMDHLQQAVKGNEQVVVRNTSDENGVLVVAGPESRQLLQPLTDTNLDSEQFPWLSGREITVAGISLIALRVNYVGELGWELHLPMQRLEELYESLWLAGQPLGVANFGLYAVNSLRMEKAYRGWGAELTNEVTMLDAVMERFIKFDKDEFTGRDATLAQREAGLAMRLIYFEVEASDSEVRGGEPVFNSESCIGVTTSGAYGHYVKKSLGFAYVEPAYALAGTRLQIELLGESCMATVLDGPVYDPSNSRLKA
jgi:dimethylglycine dehydrogenase